jgi:hypothetical protein
MQHLISQFRTKTKATFKDFGEKNAGSETFETVQIDIIL